MFFLMPASTITMVIARGVGEQGNIIRVAGMIAQNSPLCRLQLLVARQSIDITI